MGEEGGEMRGQERRVGEGNGGGRREEMGRRGEGKREGDAPLTQIPA